MIVEKLSVITIETKKITETTAGSCDIVDLTAKLKECVQRTNFRAGTATLFVSGSTAALTTIEHEAGLIQDIKELVEKLVPSSRRYHHDDRWGDDNGFAHLRASLFGPSLAIPIVNGAPVLGTWQQVILIDFDNRPREREIIVQLMGDKE